MADSRRHAVEGGGWWMLPLAIAGSLLLVTTAVAAAATIRVTMMVVLPQTKRREDVIVRHVDRVEGTVMLSNHVDAVVPGEYTLYFNGDTGHAKIGEILQFGDGSVTRALLAEEVGSLSDGMRSRVSGWYYASPAELGFPYTDVLVPTDLGLAPAWLVPANKDDANKDDADSDDADRDDGRWVIQVHGRGVDRTEAIRAIPVFREAGYTSLLISYRNDGLAPASPEGRYALGDTEWRDVEAAVRYARDHGARDIVLMGWSMGGALVLQAVTRSPLSRFVRGIILDSPVIDWVSVLDHQAGALGVPAPIKTAVFAILRSRWGRLLTGQPDGINLARLDFVKRARELTVPILLMHSNADTFVPADASHTLARLRPDIVTFESFGGAGHTRLWNYDRKRWNSAIADWLASGPRAFREPAA